MKTLLQKVNEELLKQDLEFNNVKEYNEKFKGTLKDVKTGIEIQFETPKSLQYNSIKSFVKIYGRDYMDMIIKLKGGER